MADISKCSNEYCSIKETCFRYTCKPCEFMQVYGSFVQDKDGKCEYYWDDKDVNHKNWEE